ncbi:hypothetical protein B0H13DRAFT_1851561 [Mycena leptocephala]|nr:hypothetical protein B0H13DRAFT_1851561 [Mycena leptocephala]
MSAELDVPPVSGKAEHMVSHLTSCRNVTPDLRTLAQSLSKKENRDNIPRLSRNQEIARSVVLSPDIQMPPLHVTPTNFAPPTIRRTTLNVVHPVPDSLPISTSSPRMWDPPKQEEFAEDLCKLFIACNVAWNSAANPELLLFFSKYVPEAKIPSEMFRMSSLSWESIDTMPKDAKLSYLKGFFLRAQN